MNKALCRLALLFLCLANSRAQAQEQAIQGLQKTLKRIETLRSMFLVKALDDGKLSSKASVVWFQQGDQLRINLEDEMLVGGDEKKPAAGRTLNLLMVGGKPTIIYAVNFVLPGLDRQKKDEKFTLADLGVFNLWSLAGLLVSDRPEITLVDALLSTDWKRESKAVELGGKKYNWIEAISTVADKPSFQVWLDPEHSDLPKRLLVFNDRGRFDPKKAYNEIEVKEFHKPYKNTGISFPAQTYKKRFGPGQKTPYGEDQTAFQVVQINDVLDPKMFHPPTATDKEEGQRKKGWITFDPTLWAIVAVVVVLVGSYVLFGRRKPTAKKTE
jgi:hypothetical protein